MLPQLSWRDRYQAVPAICGLSDRQDIRGMSGDCRAAYQEIVSVVTKSFSTFAYYNQFQKNLVRGLPNDWHCHAGSRYLYICENGLAHYSSQQRGFPGIPLEQYRREHLQVR
jgi:hypothetical protein